MNPIEHLLKNKKVDFINEVKERMAESALAQIEEQRVKIVDRIRKGKIQRRKKVSGVEGYTYSRGKLSRIAPQERRKRSISQRKAARKRKAKQTTATRKRRVSLRKRERLINR